MSKTIEYNKAFDKCMELMNKYGKNNIYLEVGNGKAYIVYYTMTEYKVLYEITAKNINLLTKMTIDVDESNVRFLING